MELNQIISEKQQKEVVKIIKNRCRQYQNFSKQEQVLFYEPYTSMRKKHDLTSAVISGFSPASLHIEGLSVEDLNYGLNDKLCQPEIKSKNGIFHIYSDGSDLKGKKIKERAKLYNMNLNEYPIFFVIIYSADSDATLQNVVVKVLDQEANVVEKYEIYKRTRFEVVSA